MTETPPVYQSSPQLSPSDENLWATLIHIGGIFFSFIPALIGYIVLRERSPFVAEHSRSALNFQLTMLIASIIGGILWIVVVGFIISAAVGIVVLVFSIIAALAANKHQAYVYPLSIPFVRR